MAYFLSVITLTNSTTPGLLLLFHFHNSKLHPFAELFVRTCVLLLDKLLWRTCLGCQTFLPNTRQFIPGRFVAWIWSHMSHHPRVTQWKHDGTVVFNVTLLIQIFMSPLSIKMSSRRLLFCIMLKVREMIGTSC